MSGPGDHMRKRRSTLTSIDIRTTVSLANLRNKSATPAMKPIPSMIMRSPIHFCGSRYPCQSGTYSIIHLVSHSVRGDAIPIPNTSAHTAMTPSIATSFLFPTDHIL